MSNKIYEFLERKNFASALVVIVLTGITSVWVFMLHIKQENKDCQQEKDALVKYFRSREDSIKIATDLKQEQAISREREGNSETLAELKNEIGVLRNLVNGKDDLIEGLVQKSVRNSKAAEQLYNIKKKDK